MLNSKDANPVALVPGRDRLSTQPPPTGSIVPTNTIGTVGLACWNAPTIEPLLAKTTSGESATNSAAYLRKRSRSPAPQRYSIRTLRPTAQPSSASPCAKAVMYSSPLGSLSTMLTSTPMRRTLAEGCCACTVSGHAAAPPSSVMNSRRLMLTTQLPPYRHVTAPATNVGSATTTSPPPI